MGFFSRGSGEKSSQEEQARQLLQEVQDILAQSPEKASGVLRKKAKPLYNTLSFRGPLHEEFARLLHAMWSRDPGTTLSTLPTIDAVPWSTWNDPTIGDLHSKAKESNCDIIYCTAPECRSCRDAFAEMEALRCFSSDAATAMAVLGQEDMMFRRSFLIEACPALDSRSEDIGQDMMDYAKRNGNKIVIF